MQEDETENSAKECPQGRCKSGYSQADKKPAKVQIAALGSLLIGAHGDCLATDYVGSQPVTPRRTRYILLLMFVEIIAVPDMTAALSAERILNDFISRWDCPLSIHIDQGR